MSKEIKKKKKSKGFTLIEILVAVLIVGILTAVAVPSYQKAVEKGKTSAPILNLSAIAKAQKAKKLESLHYTDKVEELNISLPDEATGEKATGSTFEGKDFTYTVYGDDEEAALATRKNVDEDEKYELSVDYNTGQIFCRPIENKTCISLGLEEGPAIEEEETWRPCDSFGRFDYFSPSTLEKCLMYTKNGTTYRKICESTWCVFLEENEDGSYSEKDIFCREAFNEDGSCDNYEQVSIRISDATGQNQIRKEMWDDSLDEDYYYCLNHVCHTTSNKRCKQYDSDFNCLVYEDVQDFPTDKSGKTLANMECEIVDPEGTCSKYHWCIPQNGSDYCENYRDQCPETPSGTCCISFRHYDPSGHIIYHRTRAEAEQACKQLYGSCKYWECGFSRNY